MATNTQIIGRVRDMLDEQTESQWTNVMLRRWINDGMADIARATLFYDQNANTAVLAGAATVALPTGVIEIQHCYWISASNTNYVVPLWPRHFESMDSVWGAWPTETGDPVAFSPRGISPSMVVYLYPIPMENGTLRTFYAGLPTPIDETGTGDASQNPIPDGWVDLLVDYVEHRALRRDRDPRWQEALALYQSARDELANYSRLAIARDITYDHSAGGQPRWLVEHEWSDWG